jgi:hypothetical protein
MTLKYKLFGKPGNLNELNDQFEKLGLEKSIIIQSGVDGFVGLSTKPELFYSINLTSTKNSKICLKQKLKINDNKYTKEDVLKSNKNIKEYARNIVNEAINYGFIIENGASLLAFINS